MTTSDSNSKPKNTGWAKPVDRLAVGEVSKEAINLNVEGRHLTGVTHGFGQLWQKTYLVRLSGSETSPEALIQTWKENFPKFWPKGNDLYVPLTGIKPGEVGVINLTAPGGMKLSTGIMVIYADDVSFSFMTPEGHMFAGMITFSAYEEDNGVIAQIQVMIRANDPLYEIGCRLGIVHNIEDKFWKSTLENLAAHFGVQGHVQQRNSLIDPRVQWKEWRNVWHNAGIRTALYSPVILARRVFRRS